MVMPTTTTTEKAITTSSKCAPNLRPRPAYDGRAREVSAGCEEAIGHSWRMQRNIVPCTWPSCTEDRFLEGDTPPARSPSSSLALGPSPAPRPSPKVTPSLPKDAILLVSYYGGQFQIALPPIPSSAIRGYTVREKLSTPSPPTRPRVGQRACDA